MNFINGCGYHDGTISFNSEEELKEAFIDLFDEDRIADALYELDHDDCQYLAMLLFARNTPNNEKVRQLRIDIIDEVAMYDDVGHCVSNDDRQLPIEDYFTYDTLIEWIIDKLN